MFSKKKNIIFIFSAVLIFSFVFIFYCFWAIYLPVDRFSEENIEFLVKRGESLKQIAENLYNKGLIKNSFLFQLYAFLSGKNKSLQAGKYVFSKSMNIPDLVNKLASGQTKKEKITIIEGWTIKDIGDYLEKKGICKSSDFVNYCKEKNLQGYLFPDTYEISYSKDVIKEITEKALANFNKKITPEIKKEIERKGRTLKEIIIMASILEKEVKTLEEKQIAAGVLWKRLENNMPLQVDCWPETYKRLGLPEFPICNPGMDSILSAVYPKETEFWYYLSIPTGETLFSKTLQEHNIKKYKFLK